MVFRAAVMGDFHGHIHHFRAVTRTLRHAGIDLLLGVGDVGFDFPGAHRGKVEKKMRLLLEQNGIDFIWAAGNHDNHDTLERLVLNPDGTRRISDRNSNLPNGSVLEINGVRIGALGGAFSVDKAWRTAGRDWWPQEEPTREEAERLVAECAKGPRLDILLTHDVPMGVEGLKGMDGLSKKTIERANQTRLLLQEAVEKVRPKALFAGHWHQRLRSGITWDDGTATMVEVLAAEQSWAGNLVQVLVDPEGEVEVSPLEIQVTFPA
ncbi:metallophosphoesterase family protein [Sinomonas sp. G460-2]|uniref:metallophosphoesterase family protein n=1 Tax=Sinomonas sp. G460-2 TaxID=3393464 RepID=UPI0039EDFE08